NENKYKNKQRGGKRGRKGFGARSRVSVEAFRYILLFPSLSHRRRRRNSPEITTHYRRGFRGEGESVRPSASSVYSDLSGGGGVTEKKMSGRGGGGGGGERNPGGKGSNGISAIPAGSRKVVQSLKEIVNCPEAEIYATLKECNMDPNEAVNRLLTQDPFREVKSKREKKKENKDTTDMRPRGASNVTHRGGRGASDRYGRGGSSHFGSTESGGMHGKPAYRKENGAHAYAGSTSYASATAGSQGGRRAPFTSDSVSAENKTPAVSVGDGVSASVQPTFGFQSAWVGAPGQKSMADIVKMGRPQNKAVLPNHTANEWNEWAPLPSSEHSAPKVPEMHNDAEASANQHAYSNNDWPSFEQPSVANVPSFKEAPSDPELYVNPSSLVDVENEHVRSEIDDVQSDEDDLDETLDESQVGPPSVSTRHIQEDGTGGSSLFDNDLYENISSYQSHRQPFEHNEAEDSSSVAANLQQLSLQNDDKVVSPEEDSPVVIIPNHLQVNAQDCSHLSFGSFASARNSGLSEPFASRPLEDNLDETAEPVEPPSAGHSDARDDDYYVDEHVRNTAEDDLVHRTNINAGNYESPSVPQPQVLKEETEEAVQGNQYAFASTPGYNYENTQHLDAAFNSQQPSSQMQNMAAFSSVMQAYSNSLPSALLASNMPTGREPELPYSPFPATQSMPTKYGTSASSISGPSMSMPEALRASSISTPQQQQQAQQSLGGAGGVATGPALPQHLVHPYSQPTLPLGHYANMISYPYLPQSYAYMPSAFQQAFAGNNTYHQSLAAVLPQYKNSVSATSLPQSAAVPPGYGFGNSTSIPAGNFPVNPSGAPASTTLSYDDMLSSQYKDSSHLMSLQQNENSAMWLQGHGSRTMSAVPANSYYNFQGQQNQQQQQQQQQPSGFRQGQQQQQPSQQHFGGALGYPNYYHSQAGISMDHHHQQQQQLQQQNARDGSLGNSQQGQGAKQNQQQQLWQNSY
ncbi:GBF-interacting protein 1, partial [Linum perenne]